jgi:hypothetical protein
MVALANAGQNSTTLRRRSVGKPTDREDHKLRLEY